MNRSLVSDNPPVKSEEQSVRETAERLRLFVEYAQVAIAMFDREMRYLAASRCWIDYVPGIGNYVGRSHYEIFPECPAAWRDEHRRALSGETIRVPEHCFRWPDGKVVWTRYEVRPWYEADGQVGGIVIYTDNITERKQAEQALREKEELLNHRVEELETLLDMIPAPTWIARDALCLEVLRNRAAAKLFSETPSHDGALARVTPANTQRQYFREGREVDPHELPLQRAVATGMAQHEEQIEVELTNSRRIVLTGGAAPLFDRGGRVRGGVATFNDITEHKKVEIALRESRQRLQAILDATSDAIVTINHTGSIQSVNRATERLFLYSPPELGGESFSLLLPVQFRDPIQYLINDPHRPGQSQNGQWPREICCLRRDGSVFPAELTVNEIPELGLHTLIFHDVSSRKSLEREVVEAASSEQRRIGQDLHDTLGQELTGLNLMAQTLRANPEIGVPLIERISHGLRECQHRLRSIMRGLLPVSVDHEGLMAALSDLADRTGRENCVECQFECPAAVSIKNNLVATHLYLIAQEAVHNALKHAQPRTIRVTLVAHDHLLLRIADDGRGMTVRSANGSGLGLRIMRNRAEIINAVLEITPALPTGTVVTCKILSERHQ